MAPLLNYTTKVSVVRTAGEVQAMLGGHGAQRVMIDYGPDRQPCGISFALPTAHGVRGFTLPVDAVAVHRLLNSGDTAAALRRQSKGAAAWRSPEHAARVAWRVVKDWLEAQLALVETAQVTLDQIMLPYLVVAPDGTTLHQRYLAAGMSALEVGDA